MISRIYNKDVKEGQATKKFKDANSFSLEYMEGKVALMNVMILGQSWDVFTYFQTHLDFSFFS